MSGDNRCLRSISLAGYTFVRVGNKKEKQRISLCDRRRSEVLLQHERDGPAQSRIARRVCGNDARGRVSEGAAFDDFIDDRADPVPGAGNLSDHHNDVRGEYRDEQRDAYYQITRLLIAGVDRYQVYLF